MTNKEVIKLFAEKRPDLIAELFDDIYCWGWNDGIRSNKDSTLYDTCPMFNDEEWLNSEYDKDLFRESDVEELI